jgi:hypothetical protein
MLIGAGVRRVLAGAVTVAAIAGCGTVAATPPLAASAPAASGTAVSTTAERSSATHPAMADPTTNPLRIIGDWRVIRARGAAAGTPVRFGYQQLAFRQACGEFGGAWTAARGGLFLAETEGFAEKCLHTGNLDPAWLRTATRFTVVGPRASRRLTIFDGRRVLAVLRPGRYPRPGPDGSFVPGPAPRVTAAIRGAFVPPKALPAGLKPATEQSLVGRWRPLGPVDPRYSDIVLTVRADGDWAGTDGCNVQASRWESGPDGLLLVSPFGQTLVGCPRAPHASLADAARAGFRGTTLVLVDRTGAVVERLRRA